MNMTLAVGFAVASRDITAFCFTLLRDRTLVEAILTNRGQAQVVLHTLSILDIRRMWGFKCGSNGAQ